MSSVRIFTLYERFWHWSQAVLIFGLLLTGFEIHGTYGLLGYNTAFSIHIVLAWALIVLWAFTIFWHVVTGEWRQYVPTHRGMLAVMMYYAYGIFSGEAKPYTQTPASKHNPLQRMAYFSFKAAIAPALWISGLLLLFYAAWRGTALEGLLPFATVAYVHVAAAFGLLVFIIGHVYMAGTTGDPWYAYLKSMFTGKKEGRSDSH
ncbi:cytochrome B561 [Ectothiorhodospira haloalkaliphila]|uniref:Cytochrome B561 n=1 Tax=Ectothiorhodospira haloalkaliphila TaxID=421628 RepID=W8L8S1_9GAMM|nr:MULTISPECIES: cytochrome b/b6 domain-containing protein [Ectothiorhodospira]AHK80230.1 cytochrome B561 [Ectothiorhodospira haloalkaliphila]MCG5494612.1 cytochrome b/b6 domain-containing protein [Ectothiorhodospira variabilis]MCG5496156.1 cytochrome b/b6 domain-containing protein [Ectothiorhodospira variabilis]MCG5503603.1 cytochrome b/b6 domain-containing protein [Ectothiorhodospira variabilis]MCG5506682.1 cytochrome b/b6 domain-containing protein [Ectothiorhodospira variabilis]